MIAVIGLLLGFLLSAFFLIQGKRRGSNGDHQEKKRSSSNEPVRPKSYSKSEVAEHNKRDDCWIIIKDKDKKMIAVIGLLLGFLLSAFFLIQGKRRGSNGDHQEKKRSSSNEPVRPKSYSKSEVAEHNKRDDCWIIIKDKVYDVTSYVEEHPGADAILNHAGDDSTDGFFGPQHATRVFDMIEDFYIGELRK